MIAFIDDHRQAYGVGPICRVLAIAPSTYHAHAANRLVQNCGRTRDEKSGIDLTIETAKAQR